MRPSRDLLKLAWWLVAAFALCAAIFVRVRLLSMPLERDEGEYAYAGQLLLERIPPYQLAYNMKFPGAYLVYACCLALFGQTAAAIHFGFFLVNLATTVLVFFVGRRLLANNTAAAVAAAFFAVFALSPSILGLAAHVEHLVVLPMLGGLLLLLGRGVQKLWWTIFAGVFFGVAVLMKQPAASFVVGGACLTLHRDVRLGLGWQRTAVDLAGFCAGAALPVGVAMLLLWCAGVFDNFWFWTIEYARAYGTIVPWREGLLIGRASAQIVLGPIWPLCALACAGLIAVFVRRSHRKGAVVLVVLLIAAVVALSSGFWFRHHYYVDLLPVLALFCGTVVAAAAELSRRRAVAMQGVLLTVVVATLLYPLVKWRNIYFLLPPEKACETIYRGNIFAAAPRISEFVRAQMAPDDRLAILGSEPEIYFYARRHSATGYIYMYALMEEQPYARKMQLQMEHEIEQARPKFLIIVTVPMSWGFTQSSDLSVIDWMNELSLKHYHLVGAVNVSPTGATEYCLPCDHQLDPWPASVLISQRNSE